LTPVGALVYDSSEQRVFSNKEAVIRSESFADDAIDSK
jgi:hypothetical protein